MQNPRRWPPRASALLLAPVLMVAAAHAARAAGCVDDVRSLAQRYHVSSDPPTAPAEKSPPTAAVRPGDLARSGGVIAPPPSPDKAVITPPRSAHDAMPTVPDVKDTPPEERVVRQPTVQWHDRRHRQARRCADDGAASGPRRRARPGRARRGGRMPGSAARGPRTHRARPEVTGVRWLFALQGGGDDPSSPSRSFASAAKAPSG